MRAPEDLKEERKYLPSFRAGASGVVEIASVLFDGALSTLGIPGGSALSKAINRLVEKRMREAQTALVRELEKGDLRVLSDPEVEEFVPIGFRFFQAARDGEAKHVIETLAKIIHGEIVAKEVRSAEFQRYTQQLSGLSDTELKLIAAFASGGTAYRTKPDLSSLQRASLTKVLIKQLVPTSFSSERAFYAACALLAGRGLLSAHVVQNLDDLTLDYAATSDLFKIWKLASEGEVTRDA